MRGLTLCLALTAGLLAAEEKGTKLEGKWVATALRHGDAETPKEEIDKGEVTLTVTGERFVFKTPKETHEGKLTADPSAKPMTMDLLIEAKDGKKKTIHCIYEWDGDALRIAGDQEKRPKDFKSKLGGSIVVALKRSKG